MAVIKTSCACGVEVTVRTDQDARTNGRKDGKQVVYTGKELMHSPKEYDIFRCSGCGKPISETCKEAAYEAV